MKMSCFQASGLKLYFSLLLLLILSSCGSQPSIKDYDSSQTQAAQLPTEDTTTTPDPESSNAEPANEEEPPKECPTLASHQIKEIIFSQVNTPEPLPALNPNLNINSNNDFGFYNTLFAKNDGEGRDLLNTAVDYGVRVKWANPKPGEYYWKAIGIHHLLPNENGGRHHIFVEILDDQGHPLREGNYFLEKNITGLPKEIIAMDKPASEPFTNVPMFKGSITSVKIMGKSNTSSDLSDEVVNLHTSHPDEPLPNGELKNTLFHHSFYVVFRKTLKAPKTEPKGMITLNIYEPNSQILVLKGDGGYEQSFPLTAEAKDTLVIPELSLGRYQLTLGESILNEPKDLTLSASSPLAHIEIITKANEPTATCSP